MKTLASNPDVYANINDLIGLRQAARGFSFSSRQKLSSALAGRMASRLRGRGLEFEELRHYLPGDDIRTMDWRVTRRTGRPHVRVFNEEKEQSVLLLIDQRQAMFFGSRVRMKSVAASHMAALAAWRVLDAGDRVGAIIFNDTKVTEIKPRRSRGNVIDIIRQTVRYNHLLKSGESVIRGEPELNRTINRAQRLCGHDVLILIVSDMNGWSSETLERLKQIRRHNSVIVSLIYDPLEQSLPGSGQLVVSDGELQIQIDPGKGDMSLRFATSVEHSSAQLREQLDTLAIPVILLDTIDPVITQLQRAIGGTGRPQVLRVPAAVL